MQGILDARHIFVQLDSAPRKGTTTTTTELSSPLLLSLHLLHIISIQSHTTPTRLLATNAQCQTQRKQAQPNATHPSIQRQPRKTTYPAKQPQCISYQAASAHPRPPKPFHAIPCNLTHPPRAPQKQERPSTETPASQVKPRKCHRQQRKIV